MLRALFFGIVVVLSHRALHAQDHGEPADSMQPPIVDSTDVGHSRERNEENTTEYLPGWHDMFTRVPGDWGRFSRENFQATRIPAIMGLAALTGALIATDHDSWHSTERWSNRTRSSREIMNSFAEFGNGRTVLAFAGAFALGGWVADDARALRTASQIVECYLACGIAVQLLKHLTGRERPERQSVPRGKWRFFPNQAEYHRSIPKFDAFPSGHTTGAMGLVTVLIENYPELKWLRPVGYGAVGLVMVSLVSRGWHWYSDFPLALVLGYQFGRIAAQPDNREETQQHTLRPVPTLSFSPLIGATGAGMMVSFTF
ncbi:MAG: hypothetical protein C4326_01780 [Ignavibacteria bacterium]